MTDYKNVVFCLANIFFNMGIGTSIYESVTLLDNLIAFKWILKERLKPALDRSKILSVFRNLIGSAVSQILTNTSFII